MTLQVADAARVRTLTLDRPEALNAFNEALYDALADALLDAADDPTVAVVLLTGNGRGFSAGTDLLEMHQIATDPTFERGRHGFPGLVDALDAFPKPLVVAVNGIGLGIGCTILGFADLSFMSSEARLKCPFTSLGVAPEAASSYLCRCWSAARTPPGCSSPRSGSPPMRRSRWGWSGGSARPTRCWTRPAGMPRCWRPSRSPPWSR